MIEKTKLIVIANQIRSLYNVGAIFRTCDAIGAEKLYLVGYTATPENQPIRLAKTALGAEHSVPWEHIKTIVPTIKKLKVAGYEIIGLEERRGQSVNYCKWNPSKKICLILGNEVTGISPSLAKHCDKLIELPMKGVKKSLNVTVAFGGIAYYILAKNG